MTPQNRCRNRPRRPSLTFSLARVLVLGPALLLGAAGDPSTPQSRMDKSIWAQRFTEQLPELRSGHFDVIFLGDSITRELTVPGQQDWSNVKQVWDRWFACHAPIDLGYAGDTTANLLWRIQNGGLPAQAPKAAVLMIGTNNNRAALGWTGQQTGQAILAIVADLHRRFPAMRIIVLGIPPNAHGPAVAAKIDAANAVLSGADLATMNAVFVPTTDLFMQAGQLKTDLFREPHRGGIALHPDTQGWELIAERLAPVLDRALGVASGPCAGAALPQ
jgi:lysophospholipase L1-like esterase